MSKEATIMRNESYREWLMDSITKALPLLSDEYLDLVRIVATGLAEGKEAPKAGQKHRGTSQKQTTQPLASALYHAVAARGKKGMVSNG